MHAVSLYDRSDIAAILGIAPEQVRIIPTAVGGIWFKARSFGAAVPGGRGRGIWKADTHGLFAD